MLRKILIVLATLPHLAMLGAAQQKPASASAGSYANSQSGLQKLAKKILDATKKGDSATVEAETRAMLLPDPDAWFRGAFGEEQGEFYARAYKQSEANFPPLLAREFDQFVKTQIGRLEATRFERACDPIATPIEYPVLASRVQDVPLYDIRGVHPDVRGETISYIWAFAYVDGGFRYLGNLRSLAAFREFKGTVQVPGPDAGQTGGEETTKRIRVGGLVQVAKLIHKVVPEYPGEAKAQHIEGEVLLHALIAKDGSVRNLELIQGHCWLAQPALAAVRQWKYSPTMLAGQPVEVETTITVIFTLGGK